MSQFDSLFRFYSDDIPLFINSSRFEMDPEFTWEDPLGATPLHYACFFSFVSEEKVRELLKAGIDLNAQDKKGLTALHYLALSTQGRVEKAALLIERGADLKLQDEDGQSALDYALKAGRHSLVQLFLELGGKIDELEVTGPNQLNEEGQNPLHLACSKEVNNYNTAIFLLKRGANPNLQDQDGNTPHHLSALVAGYLSDYRIFELMLHHGVDLNLENKEGHTSADVYSLNWHEDGTSSEEKMKQHYRFIIKLYENGLDPNRPALFRFFDRNKIVMQGIKKAKPIHLAMFTDTKGCNLSFSLLKVLVENGADVNAQDDKGQTPLHWCTRFRIIENPFFKIRYLLENGADPTIKNHDGQLPRDFTTVHSPDYFKLLRRWELKAHSRKSPK